MISSRGWRGSDILHSPAHEGGGGIFWVFFSSARVHGGGCRPAPMVIWHLQFARVNAHAFFCRTEISKMQAVRLCVDHQFWMLFMIPWKKILFFISRLGVGEGRQQSISPNNWVCSDTIKPTWASELFLPQTYFRDLVAYLCFFYMTALYSRISTMGVGARPPARTHPQFTSFVFLSESQIV